MGRTMEWKDVAWPEENGFRIARFRTGASVRAQLPNLERIAAVDCAIVSRGEQAGKSWLVIDMTTAADFLEPDQDPVEFGACITVMQFETSADLERYLENSQWAPFVKEYKKRGRRGV